MLRPSPVSIRPPAVPTFPSQPSEQRRIQQVVRIEALLESPKRFEVGPEFVQALLRLDGLDAAGIEAAPWPSGSARWRRC